LKRLLVNIQNYVEVVEKSDKTVKWTESKLEKSVKRAELKQGKKKD
jgi:hypothetical protein